MKIINGVFTFKGQINFARKYVLSIYLLDFTETKMQALKLGQFEALPIDTRTSRVAKKGNPKNIDKVLFVMWRWTYYLIHYLFRPRSKRLKGRSVGL